MNTRPAVTPVPIYVLSLVHDRTRRAAVQRELGGQGLAFSFVDAVDGQELTEEDLARSYDPARNVHDYKRPLSRGEIACALGHRAIWQRIIEEEASTALVCEDDLLASAHLAGFLRAVSACSAAFSHVLVKLDSPLRRGMQVARLAGIELVATRRIPGRTTGYLIGQGAASRLLTRPRRMTRPIDMDLKSYWEHRVPIVLARPQLISARTAARSRIEAHRNRTKPIRPWHRLVRNLRYQSAVNLSRLRAPVPVEHPILTDLGKALGSPGQDDASASDRAAFRSNAAAARTNRPSRK